MAQLPPRLDYLIDPYHVYRTLRSTDPLAWNDTAGTWLVTGYAPVVSSLRSPLLSSARPRPMLGHLAEAERQAAHVVYDSLAQWLVRADPPEHTRVRALLNRAFTPGDVEELRPRIRQRTDDLLQALAGAGHFDIIADLAQPLVSGVIGDLLGIPIGDRVLFQQWSKDIALMADAGPGSRRSERAAASLEAATTYVGSLIGQRRQEPRPDLVGRLAGLRRHDRRLGDPEITGACMLILLAGSDTSVHMFASAVHTLLRHPEQFAELRPKRDMIGRAVEELIRFDSPLQGVLRHCVSDVEVAGKRLAAGQPVLVSLGAANHDPAKFANPDDLDIRRNDLQSPHLGFGHGRHYCLGAQLARAILRIGLGLLVQRMPSLRLATEELVWEGNTLFRSLRVLPVQC